jgi:hypothetical protein
MSQESPVNTPCPLCGGQLEKGYVHQGRGKFYLAKWAKGEPTPALFFGDIRAPDTPQYMLEAFRCASCGYVMFFARNPA